MLLCLGQIPTDQQSNDPSQSDKQDVLCLCFSPSEETLIASTNKNQLYSITMSLTEISKVSLPQGHQPPSSPRWEAHPRGCSPRALKSMQSLVQFMRPIHTSKRKS
jgi:hypothetical protein